MAPDPALADARHPVHLKENWMTRRFCFKMMIGRPGVFRSALLDWAGIRTSNPMHRTRMPVKPD